MGSVRHMFTCLDSCMRVHMYLKALVCVLIKLFAGFLGPGDRRIKGYSLLSGS